MSAMSEPTHASPLTATALNAALLALRAEVTSGTSLWDGLIQRLNATPESLAKALWELQGVASIADAQWPSVQLLQVHTLRNAGSESSGQSRVFAVSLEGTTLLLCEDPWAQEIILWSFHGPVGGLALARPGQIDALSFAASTGPANNADASKPGAASLSGSPVVQLVEDAIAQACREGASDIHFETSRAGLAVKFRLDGVMAVGPQLADPTRAEEVISRIKVMAQLDITESRRPQDGRIHWKHADLGAVDLRVSIMPSIFGEDAVLRLLDKAQLRESSTGVSLTALGFDAPMAARLRDLATRPHGMLLITGPTGSGKTTTVYAALTEVNDGLEKIITIEDPVEYELPGVLQIPVNEQKGLTFATGLRSILRHDPDKILSVKSGMPKQRKLPCNRHLPDIWCSPRFTPTACLTYWGAFSILGSSPLPSLQRSTVSWSSACYAVCALTATNGEP